MGRRRPRLRLRTLLVGIALFAVALWGGLVLVSPTRWLERRLRSDAPASARMDAVGALGGSWPIPPWETNRAVTALINALDDSNAMVRMGAIVQIDRRGGAAVRALPALVDRLGDESRTVRAAAAGALGKLAPMAVDRPTRSRAEDALIDATDDPDPYVRLAASLSLLELGRAGEAADGIVEALTGADELIRNTAAGRLRNRGAQPPVIVSALLELAEVGDPEVAQLMLLVLVEIAPPDVVRPALQRAVTSQDAETREEASALLGRIRFESEGEPP